MCLILLLTASAAAMAGGKYLYVTDIDNSTIAIKIEDGMQCEVMCPETGDVRPYSLYIYGSSGEFVMLGERSLFVDAGHMSREMPFSQIKSVSMVNPSGVEGVSAISLQIDIANSIITVSGLTEPTNVTVSTVQGVVLMNESVTDGASIDLSRLGRGVMIVTVGTKTFKINVL